MRFLCDYSGGSTNSSERGSRTSAIFTAAFEFTNRAKMDVRIRLLFRETPNLALSRIKSALPLDVVT